MLMRNLRHTIRALLRSPGFAVPAVATLALGIAGCTVVFSVFDAIVLRPLPYANAGRVVMIWDSLAKLGIEQLAPSVANYFEYRDHSHAFRDMAAFEYGELNLTGSADAPPERVRSVSVTPSQTYLKFERMAFSSWWTAVGFWRGHREPPRYLP